MSRLRFVRALALLGSAHVVACGDDDGASIAPNASTTLEPTVSRGDGHCVSLEGNHIQTISCAASHACVYPEDAGAPSCVDVEPPDAEVCGSVTCGAECFCFDAPKSDCTCFHGPSGPLPPPDLAFGGKMASLSVVEGSAGHEQRSC